jgi:hypothetical protein
MIGIGIDDETQEAMQGLANVRLELAQRAQRRSDFQEAALHINRVLAIDPLNEQAIRFKRENDRALEASPAECPAQKSSRSLPRRRPSASNRALMCRMAKRSMRWGAFPKRRRIAAGGRLDPENQAAYYYLKLISEAKYAQGAYQREVMAKEKGVEVEDAWLPHTQRDYSPPQPLRDHQSHPYRPRPAIDPIQTASHRPQRGPLRWTQPAGCPQLSASDSASA